MDSEKEQSKKPAKPKERSSLARILDFAGGRKALTYLGCVLSGISQLLAFGPFVCIWFVARDLIDVAPNWQNATHIAEYGWIAVALAVASIIVYFCALMCTHMAAFRTASNMRKQTTEHLMHLPLGFFDTHATGELRRVIDGCAAQTETLLAHTLPDCAGSVVMVLGMLVMMFAFDWRLGLACMVAVVLSFFCMAAMMSGEGMEFMKQYMGALTKMNKTGTEYVRGIPVVKVFQQTVYSFKAFHDAITEYAAMAKNYAVNFCRPPQVAQLSVLNGLVVFLVPAAILLAPGEADFTGFVTNFAFYAIFSAIIPTAMTKLMFMSEASQMAGDAIGEVGKLLATPPLPVSAQPKRANGNDIAFDNVSFTYEGATEPALSNVSFTVPAGATVALVAPADRANRPPPAWCRVFGMQPQVAYVSAAPTCAIWTPPTLWGKWRLCSRPTSCLRRALPTTCAPRAPRQPMPKCWPPFRPRNATTSWPSCRRAFTPSWVRAVPISRAAKCSAWRWRAPF